MGSEMGPPISE